MPRGPLFEHVFTCSNCGKEVGRSSTGSLLDRPASCPFCGVKFINGGLGNGNPGIGGPLNPGVGPNRPGNVPPAGFVGVPGTNPGVGVPPAQPPAQPVNLPPPIQPSNNNPGVNVPPAGGILGSNPAPAPAAPTSTDSSSLSSSSSESSGRGWVLPVVIGVIIVGVLALAGGVWLMLASGKDERSTPRRRRPRYAD